MTIAAPFSDHERKLFRQRFLLGPLAGGGALVAAAGLGLRIGGWAWVAVALGFVVWAVAAIRLAATEHATNLERFDALLTESDREVAKGLRFRGGAARFCLGATFLMLLYYGPLEGDLPAILALAILGAGCGLYAHWMFLRETAIMRTVAGLSA